jgi:hypothetical protein
MKSVAITAMMLVASVAGAAAEKDGFTTIARNVRRTAGGS